MNIAPTRGSLNAFRALLRVFALASLVLCLRIDRAMNIAPVPLLPDRTTNTSPTFPTSSFLFARVKALPFTLASVGTSIGLVDSSVPTFLVLVCPRCRCDHESNQIETFSCRRTKPERRPQTKDGQAPVPRVRVFPIMSLLRSELN